MIAEPRRLSNRARTVFALALLVLIGGLFWQHHQIRETTPADPSQMIGRPASTFTLKPLLLSRPGLQTADLKGHVTLVNFFASWCVACRAEHPVLALAAQHGIAVVGIAYKDRPPSAAAYLADLGNPYGRLAADADGRVAADFAVTGAPDTFLVDRDGIIRYRSAGPLTEKILNAEILPLAARL